MLCSYCSGAIAGDPVESYRMGDRVTAICRPCSGRVGAERVGDLAGAWREFEATHPQPPEQSLDWLVARARAFLCDRPTDDRWGSVGAREDRGDAYAEAEACFRFWHLIRSAPIAWMPSSSDAGNRRPKWGRRMVPGFAGNWDGKRRIAMAIALGVDEIRVLRRPLVAPPWLDGDPYQTIVLPTGAIPGERPPDRWPLVPDLTGASILELGCAEGMTGIAAVAAGAASYRGMEKNPDRVRWAADIARAWGVEDRVAVEFGDATTAKIPRADVLFCFSTAIQMGIDPHMRALRESGARQIVLETHRLGDPESEALMHAIGGPWTFLGASALDRTGCRVRRLFVRDLP